MDIGRVLIIAGVVLVVVVVVIAYSSLNAIVRAAVERQSTASLGVATTLGSAKLSLFGGKVNMNDLEVGSPPSFAAPHVFTLDGIGVAVEIGKLTGTPIHVSQIVIDHPVLIVEQSNMKLNLKALMARLMMTRPIFSGSQNTCGRSGDKSKESVMLLASARCWSVDWMRSRIRSNWRGSRPPCSRAPSWSFSRQLRVSSS